MSSEVPVISVRGLGKVYHLYDRAQDRLKQAFMWGRRQYYREFWALRDIQFDIPRGQVVGVIGRNGAGKSTLLQIICGVLQPTTGTAEVHGRVAALLELGSGFNPEFTGRENVYMNAAILGLSQEQIDQRYDRIVQFAEIGPFIDQPTKTYSSGMTMRLAFAITVHVDADVLVVDEALSVGDVAFQFKCLHHLEQLLDRGVTILLVSHDIQLVKGYCSRALYLKENKLSFDGDCETATELYLKDMRAFRANQGEVQIKAALSADMGIRFGGEKGRLVSVTLGGQGADGLDERRNFFTPGDRVWLDVRAWIDKSVRWPRLSILVRDVRGYNLFGFNTAYAQCTLVADADGIIAGRFRFTCHLQPGDYSITVRVMDFISETANELLDKQVNSATFKVTSRQKTFDGVVDLAGTFEPAGGAAAAVAAEVNQPAAGG
jgi:lipopolysaccharide transport system ATP-binding protein